MEQLNTCELVDEYHVYHLEKHFVCIYIFWGYPYVGIDMHTHTYIYTHVHTHTPVTYMHHSHGHKSITLPQVKPDVELAPADAAPEAMGSTHGDPNPKAAPCRRGSSRCHVGSICGRAAWACLGHLGTLKLQPSTCNFLQLVRQVTPSAHSCVASWVPGSTGS